MVKKLKKLVRYLSKEACEILIKNATDSWKKENSKTIDDISCAILFLNIK